MEGLQKMKSLEFQVVEGNMGAQYHHYLLGIILQNEEGKEVCL